MVQSKWRLIVVMALVVWLVSCAAPRSTPEVRPEVGGESQAASAEGLCPDVPRPAMVASASSGASYIVMSADGEAVCELEFPSSEGVYGLTGAAGSLFYARTDDEAQMEMVWRVNVDGMHQPLPFTAISLAGEPAYNFVVSADGSKVAWAATSLNEVSGASVGSLWVANVDGSEVVTLLDNFEAGGNSDLRVIEPVQFGPDNSLLFYAIQPGRRPAVWTIVTGRYDQLFRVPVAGGEAEGVFSCASVELSLCIGDITDDGSVFAYTDTNEGVIQVVGEDGVISTLRPPAGNYFGMPTFSPSGELAFVSAAFTQVEGAPVPQPGMVSVLPPPYLDEPEVVLEEDGVAMLGQWVDEEHLVHQSFYGQGFGLGILSIEAGQGEAMPLEGVNNLVTVLE